MSDTIAEALAAAPRSRAWLAWLPLILGVILSLSYLDWARVHVVVLLDHVAFGRETQFYSASDWAQCQDATDSPKCVNAWVQAGKPPVVLWFGNSQLMGINRAQPGDVNAPGLLRAALQPRGYRLVTYSQPNANLSEESIVFDAIAPIYKPKLFILPVCYDDIRELDIRDTIAAFRGSNAPAKAAAGDTPKAAEPGKVATSATVQSKVEGVVTAKLSSHWPLWAARNDLRGTAGAALHQIRNKVLGIHSTSKRPVDPNVYSARMQLLEQIVARARGQGMAVLLYVPPYRQDIDGPYVLADYHKFKEDMKAIAARQGARYADLEPIVPGPEWATVVEELFGFKEPDFMHFTEAGHQKLAAAVDQQIRAMGY